MIITYLGQQRKSRARKAKKEKDSIHKKIMFIHIDYLLQTETHRYYSRIQDTLQIDTRAVYIPR